LHVKQTAEELVEQGRLETLPTFFEHVTVIALLAFREAKVDLAILETGLGGRLDSTTAAGAEIVAITAIAKDHEEYLGHTLAEIAAEKAAIIRRGVTAIVTPQKEDALEVILDRCESVGVKPRYVQRARYENISTGLRGRHQIENVSTAICSGRSFAANAVSRSNTKRSFAELKRLRIRDAWNCGTANRKFSLMARTIRRPPSPALLPGRVCQTTHHDDLWSDARQSIIRDGCDAVPKADELILTELDNPRAATGEILLSAVPATSTRQECGSHHPRERPCNSREK